MLLDAAQALFLAQGYGETTVEQIARRIGATKRTVYAKFGDKAGLFAAMTRRLVDRNRAWLNDDIAGTTVDERLRHFGMRLLAQVAEPDILALHRVIVAETHNFPELALLVDQLASTGVRHRLAQILAHEAAQGFLQIEDAELSAEFLIGMFLHSAILGSMLGRKTVAHSDPALWVASAVAMFLDGSRGTQRGRGAEGGEKPVSIPAAAASARRPGVRRAGRGSRRGCPEA